VTLSQTYSYSLKLLKMATLKRQGFISVDDALGQRDKQKKKSGRARNAFLLFMRPSLRFRAESFCPLGTLTIWTDLWLFLLIYWKGNVSVHCLLNSSQHSILDTFKESGSQNNLAFSSNSFLCSSTQARSPKFFYSLLSLKKVNPPQWKSYDDELAVESPSSTLKFKCGRISWLTFSQEQSQLLNYQL